MQTLLLASHEYGKQHCPVAVQSAPNVLGSVQESPPPATAEGEAAAGVTDPGVGAVVSVVGESCQRDGLGLRVDKDMVKGR